MDIDKIAFTGSTNTGRQIAIAAAQSNLKKVSLELGGKSANVVFESANLEEAAKWSAFGIFENAGEFGNTWRRQCLPTTQHHVAVRKLKLHCT